jgi:hypothetical protein
MRKLILAALSVLAIVATIPATSHAADNVLQRLTWRRNAAASYRTLDSASVNFANLSTAAGFADTTQSIATQEIDWNANTLASTTPQGFAKLFLYSSNTAIAGDSIYVAIDWSVDGTNWVNGAFAGAATLNSGDKAVAVPLLYDSDAASSNPWRAPMIRLRVAGDTGGVANANLYASIAYQKLSRSN